MAPKILAHMTFDEGRWAVRDTSDYPRHHEPAGHVLYRLIRDLGDMLPEGTFWDRPRARASTTHGQYLIRRSVQDYLNARSEGLACDCGQFCRFPHEPVSARA